MTAISVRCWAERASPHFMVTSYLWPPTFGDPVTRYQPNLTPSLPSHHELRSLITRNPLPRAKQQEYKPHNVDSVYVTVPVSAHIAPLIRLYTRRRGGVPCVTEPSATRPRARPHRLAGDSADGVEKLGHVQLGAGREPVEEWAGDGPAGQGGLSQGIPSALPSPLCHTSQPRELHLCSAALARYGRRY